MTIYLDNASTTRPDNRVIDLVAAAQREFYGNDASVHIMGVEAGKRTEKARQQAAAALNAAPEEIIFTSGGTEANNLALLGALTGRPGKTHLVLSGMEHASVANPVLRLERSGIAVTVVDPDSLGLIDLEAVKRALRPETALVSVMHANNETGVIQPIAEIGGICRRAGVLFHSDACQSFTKAPLDVKECCVDLLTVNSHKLHGPKGVGAIYIRKGVSLAPLMEGGGHEEGLRPGTRNSPAIAGFGLAITLSTPALTEKTAALRDFFWERFHKAVPEARLNCAGAPRLPGILSITLPGISGAAALVRAMSARGICLSAGSACAAGSNEPSRALKAIGLSDEEALRTIRVSLSRFNTEEELSLTVKEIAAYAA